MAGNQTSLTVDTQTLDTVCARHADEIFPVRCYACGTATVDENAAATHAPVTTDGMCSLHAYYPAPCARCERDREADLEENDNAPT